MTNLLDFKDKDKFKNLKQKYQIIDYGENIDQHNAFQKVKDIDQRVYIYLSCPLNIKASFQHVRT